MHIWYYLLSYFGGIIVDFQILFFIFFLILLPWSYYQISRYMYGWVQLIKLGKSLFSFLYILLCKYIIAHKQFAFIHLLRQWSTLWPISSCCYYCLDCPAVFLVLLIPVCSIIRYQFQIYISSFKTRLQYILYQQLENGDYNMID